MPILPAWPEGKAYFRAFCTSSLTTRATEEAQSADTMTSSPPTWMVTRRAEGKGLEHVPADLLQNLKEGDLLPGDLYDAIQRGGQESNGWPYPEGRSAPAGTRPDHGPGSGEVGEHLKVVFHAVPQLLKCSPLQGQLLLQLPLAGEVVDDERARACPEERGRRWYWSTRLARAVSCLSWSHSLRAAG